MRLIFSILGILMLPTQVVLAQVSPVDAKQMEEIINGFLNSQRESSKEEQVIITPPSAEPSGQEAEEEEETRTPYFVYYQHIASPAVGGFTLRDGSEWTASAKDAHENLDWGKNDQVQVRILKDQDPRLGPTSTITNLTKQEVIQAQLSHPPTSPSSALSKLLKNNPSPSQKKLDVIRKNLKMGSMIELENGAVFNISPLFMYLTRYWTKGQPIRAALTDAEDVHSFILYNASTQEKVDALLSTPPNPPYRLKIYDEEKISLPNQHPSSYYP